MNVISICSSSQCVRCTLIQVDTIDCIQLSDALVAPQMEQHLESVVGMAGRVFYDQCSERMTHPCAPLKLHAAMHVALQQRRIEPLRSIVHPMR